MVIFKLTHNRKLFFFYSVPTYQKFDHNSLLRCDPHNLETLHCIVTMMVNKNIIMKIRNRARYNSRTQTQNLEINSKIIDRCCSEFLNIFIVTSVTITIIIVGVQNKNNKNTAFK